LCVVWSQHSKCTAWYWCDFRLTSSGWCWAVTQHGQKEKAVMNCLWVSTLQKYNSKAVAWYCWFQSYSGFVIIIILHYLYFGVLHPVARTLSRLLEEPSLATTLQSVYFIFFPATCFGPCWPSSGWIHNYFRKLLHPQHSCCFVLQGLNNKK
jgi:hypothetical protein